MVKADVIIIGAGFAGTAVAWHLTGNGVSDIIILEREELPGMHASGQNASMVRQFEEDPVIARHTFAGAEFIINPPQSWGKIIDQVGSLILFKNSRGASIETALEFSGGLGLKSEILDKDDTVSKVPVLTGASFDMSVWTATDGVTDINTLLWNYIKGAKGAGAKLRISEEVLGIKKTRGGDFEVKTEKETYKAKRVVNAAGAWSSQIGRLAGALDIKLTPLRRHLYNTDIMIDVDNRWPFVWDADNKYYFRPESGGLLLGPCDEDEVPPGIPSTSSSAREMLAEKLGSFCPGLSNVNIATEWAGLRTFAIDRRFVIGEDPRLKNFYWAAGLGGCGVTCSYEVGRLVADAILNDGRKIPKELKPERF